MHCDYYSEELLSSCRDVVFAVELQSQHERQLEEITERFELIKVALSVSSV